MREGGRGSAGAPSAVYALVEEATLEGTRPTPKLTVSEWADRYRILPQKSSAEPGPWRTDRTPYLREILDCLSAHSGVDRIVLMKGAQIGATEAGNCWVGYVIHHAPGPMLYIEPTVELAKRASKARIGPMISGSPALAGMVVEAKTRYSENTILAKEFAGGTLVMTGANSAAGLRHQSVRFLFADEVDGYPPDVGGEGDPLDLAIKRTDTFSGVRRIFICSTPTTKGLSRIESAFEATDQRYYEVPCPHCGEYQRLTWAQIQWPEGKPEAAELACLECGALIDEGHKGRMLAAGRWTPTAEAPPGVRGYHLSALYSPPGWYSWGQAARDFLDAKARGREAMKVWVNTVLGETWEEEGEAVEEGTLLARVEKYAERVPAQALVLTCGVDVQDNRLELEVVGWAPGEETWGVDYRVLWGDPAGEDLWTEIDEALSQTYRHEAGYALPIACACIDSGGHFTQQVYRFCRGKQTRRVFAVKGFSGQGRPVVEAPKHKRSGREQRHLELFHVGADQARGIVQGRLRLTAPGPGYCHFPVGWGYDPEYFRQLSAMKAVTRYSRGLPRREWVLLSGRRKEAFDCRIYALAALYILNPVWQQITKRRELQAEEAHQGGVRKGAEAAVTQAAPVREQTPRPMRRKPREGWLKRW